MNEGNKQITRGVQRMMTTLRRLYQEVDASFFNPFRERLFQDAMICLQRLHKEAAQGSFLVTMEPSPPSGAASPMADLEPMKPMAPGKGVAS